MDRTKQTGFSDYSVRISRRARRLQVRITSSGSVEVVLPHRMSPRHIAPFVSEHREWIVRTQARLMAERRNIPALHRYLPESISLYAVDRHYDVCVRLESGRRGRVTDAPGVLTVFAASESAAAGLLRQWLSGMARQYLVPWLRDVSRELELPFHRVTIRGQKTRWGSCSSRGTISLNRALLLLDRDLVRYLFVHELCHTVHMNHSRRYWKTVAGIEPRYRNYEQQLNRATMLMPLWLTHDSPPATRLGLK